MNQDALLGDVAAGQSLNRFAFVTGNPVSFVDPFGLAEICGSCAIGSMDCLIYNLNLCEPDSTTEASKTLDNYRQVMRKDYQRLTDNTRKVKDEVERLREEGNLDDAQDLVEKDLLPLLEQSVLLDKYHHCRAFCEIAKRKNSTSGFLLGEVREFITKIEIVLQLNKRETFKSCDEDRLTNMIGLGLGEKYPEQSCESTCLILNSDYERLFQ